MYKRQVNEVYDLLVEFENYIVAETIIPITHTLAGLPGTQIEKIKRVYSKSIALMQACLLYTSGGKGQKRVEKRKK